MLVTGRLPDVDSSRILPVVERIDRALDGLRILGDGEIKVALNVTANHATAGAKAAIEAAGGSAPALPEVPKVKKLPKKAAAPAAPAAAARK